MVILRAARGDDGPKIRRAFHDLDRDTVYTRFFGYKADVTDAELARITGADLEEDYQRRGMASLPAYSSTAAFWSIGDLRVSSAKGLQWVQADIPVWCESHIAVATVLIALPGGPTD